MRTRPAVLLLCILSLPGVVGQAAKSGFFKFLMASGSATMKLVADSQSVSFGLVQTIGFGEKTMEGRCVVHGTFVIERSYPTTPQRVFAAFSDPSKKRRWFAEGEASEMEEYEMDFRVGGRERIRFRFKEGSACKNETIYQDILRNRRIVFAYTMTIGDQCISSSQGTVELLSTEKGTDLIFTEQGAFFEGADGPKIREEGWQQLFNQLASELEN